MCIRDRCVRIAILPGVLDSGVEFYFTGFQFEPGPVATPFELRPFSTELALCQRYYQRLVATNDYTRMCLPGNGSMANTFATCPFVTSMRVAPSFTYSSFDDFILEGLTNGSTTEVTGLALNVGSTWNATIAVNGAGASSPGTGGQLLGWIGAWIAFDAEL